MTIKDIAAKCGVSVSTVSRVLNNHPYVSQKAREKVLAVIEEEHFVPHDGALSLARSDEDAIGVVVRGSQSLFFSDMTPVIEQTATDLGYSFYMETIHSSEDELRAAASLAKSRNLKGVVLLGGRYDYTPEELEVLNIPYVCCTFSNKFGRQTSDQFSYVSIDDKEEAKRATRYLIEQGHKKIAIVLAMKEDSSVSELRYHGYCEALEEHGLKPDPKLIVETRDFTLENAYEGVKTLIQSGEKFTAIFAVADIMGMAAIKALDDAGVMVPRACSVIAIDGLDISKYTVPTLTTMVQPRARIAKKAVELLIGVIENGQHDQVETSTVIRLGASVAAPPY